MEMPVSKITKDVEEALMKDPRTKNAVIDVGFNRGVLVLTGNVKNDKIRQAAEEIARTQPDVIQVVNEIKVQ